MRQASELFKTAAGFYRQLGRVVPAEAESALSLTLENGSRIVCLPGTEATIRGYGGAALLLIDEAARTTDDLMAALQPMVAVSGGRIIAMSTPFGKRGWFYETTLSTGWRTVTVRADECPRWSVEALAEFAAERGDWLARQELYAEFVDASGQMFATDDINAALEAGELGAVPARPLFGAPNLALFRAGGAA